MLFCISKSNYEYNNAFLLIVCVIFRVEHYFVL